MSPYHKTNNPHHRSLSCQRITLHKNLFCSYVLNSALTIIYLIGVVNNPEVVSRNPVSSTSYLQCNYVTATHTKSSQMLDHIHSLLLSTVCAAHFIRWGWFLRWNEGRCTVRKQLKEQSLFINRLIISVWPLHVVSTVGLVAQPRGDRQVLLHILLSESGATPNPLCRLFWTQR